MRLKILMLLILYVFLTCNVFGEPISKSKAITFAKSWFSKYDADAKTSDVFTIYNDEKIPSLYIVNFTTGGFIIVAANDKIHPILGYSYTGYFKPNSNDENSMSLLDSYSERIDYVVKNKTEKQNIETKAKWDKIGSIFQTNLKSASSDVPSLFETYQTSRWAYWNQYVISTPDDESDGICVPLAVAQICKYWKHPKQGTGSKSYEQKDDEGEPYLNEIDYSEFSYNYDLMPFRLTYCGNGEPNCNEGSFSLIPGTTTEQIKEVSDLIYHSGLAVEMKWFPEVWPYGTFGTAEDWAEAMEKHLGFSSEYDYWSTSAITNDSEGFKEAIRYDLDNERPVLFRYSTDSSGHAVVIDGYENDNYFHMAQGRGGFSDGYYYLFTDDDDGVHPIISSYGGYQAALNLKPDCTLPSTINVSSVLDSSTVEVFQATSSVSMSSIIQGNGSSGADVASYAGDEIILNPGFEIEAGAELYLQIETCGEPH